MNPRTKENKEKIDYQQIASYMVTIYVKLCSTHKSFSVLQLWLESLKTLKCSMIYTEIQCSVHQKVAG